MKNQPIEISHTCSQNWRYTKTGRKPTFYENGKRVSLERGRQLVLAGKFGRAEHLVQWFAESGNPLPYEPVA